MCGRGRRARRSAWTYPQDNCTAPCRPCLCSRTAARRSTARRLGAERRRARLRRASARRRASSARGGAAVAAAAGRQAQKRQALLESASPPGCAASAPRQRAQKCDATNCRTHVGFDLRAAKQACVAQTCSARCGRLGLPARRLYGLYRLACGANPIYTVVLIVVDERLMLHTHQLSVAWSVVDVTWL